MSKQQSFLDGRVVTKVGDITLEEADAIVNATNGKLTVGEGVNGAIHAAGGPAIAEACRKIRDERFPGGMPAGEVVITTAGQLAAEKVIHAHGPEWKGGQWNEDKSLAACYRKSLELAVTHGLRTVAMPAISTGTYAYPADLAARVASQAVDDFLAQDTSLEEVRMVFFTGKEHDVFLANCVW